MNEYSLLLAWNPYVSTGIYKKTWELGLRAGLIEIATKENKDNEDEVKQTREVCSNYL